MEVIRITAGDYERYEGLLLQRDQLEKEAESYRMEYTREFGDLITESFTLKVECIRIKKEISYFQMKKNRGEEPDPDEMKAYLDTHMAAYYAELNELIARRNFSKSGKPISQNQLNEVKNIYRRLAKLLHPDISPLTENNPELMDMFQEVITAYHCNDLKRLQELDVLISKALEELGVDHAEIIIPNIDERISELEEEISGILSTEPYTYRELLSDAVQVEEKKKALEKEIEDYRKYMAELRAYLDELTA